MKEIQLLLTLLLDENARIDEKDDAIMLLGEIGDHRALESLVKIASDKHQEYILRASAGEAIGRLMVKLDDCNKEYILPLTDEAKDELSGVIRSARPEWKKQLIAMGIKI